MKSVPWREVSVALTCWTLNSDEVKEGVFNILAEDPTWK